MVKILLLFGLIPHFVKAREVTSDSLPHNKKKEQRIGLMMEHSRNAEIFNTGLGLNLELPVGKHLALDYHFTVGWTSDRSLYMHYPHMFGLGIRGMNDLNGHENGLANGIKFVMFLFCLIPEGLSYRIDVSKNVQLVPYLHPLGEDYKKDISTGEEITESVAEFGSKLVFKLNKKLFAMPHAGVKMYYGKSSFVPQGGITLGWRMNN